MISSNFNWFEAIHKISKYITHIDYITYMTYMTFVTYINHNYISCVGYKNKLNIRVIF